MVIAVSVVTVGSGCIASSGSTYRSSSGSGGDLVVKVAMEIRSGANGNVSGSRSSNDSSLRGGGW